MLQRITDDPVLQASVLPAAACAPPPGAAVQCYCEFCSTLEVQSINVSDFDMMIAAHAVAVDATLVSRDKAFGQVGDRLRLEVW